MKSLLIFLCFVTFNLATTRASAAEIVRIPSTDPVHMSADGQWFAGSEAGIAMLWSRDHGTLNLGTLSGAASSFPEGVSQDGSVVIGFSGGKAFRWTAANGMVDLGTLPGSLESYARAVSDDGNFIAGDSGTEPWIWTAATGIVGLGLPPGATDASVYDVSADGNTVVGAIPGQRGFIWNRQSGFELLVADAWKVSTDGNTVVGPAAVGSPFRWTRDKGYIPLSALPGMDSRGGAADTTPDGAVIVGGLISSSGDAVANRGVVWDAQLSTRIVQDVLLQEHGFSSAELPVLNFVSGISRDAMTLSAQTYNVVNGGIASRTRWAIYLDKPLVTVVPEPGTWALALIAAAASLFILRTRRRLVASATAPVEIQD
jgi:probable HAF family extracellular repeat protein